MLADNPTVALNSEMLSGVKNNVLKPLLRPTRIITINDYLQIDASFYLAHRQIHTGYNRIHITRCYKHWMMT